MSVIRPRRTKIGRDPNNTAWARDEASFGQRFMRQQGWQPGGVLGDPTAGHAGMHSSASTSHIRVSLKDDSNGLGWKPGGPDGDDALTGMDVLKDIFGRLNGKAGDEGRREMERKKGLMYLGRRGGGIAFVRGGLLVGDKIEQDKSQLMDVDDEPAPPAAAEPLNQLKRKRSSDNNDSSTSDSDSDSSASTASEDERQARKRRKAEKKLRKAAKKQRKADKKAKKAAKKAAAQAGAGLLPTPPSTDSNDTSDADTADLRKAAKREKKRAKQEKKAKKEAKREKKLAKKNKRAGVEGLTPGRAHRLDAAETRQQRVVVRSRLATHKKAPLDSDAMKRLFMVG
ncbi:hypothetical protein BROUX41_006360 [Berkeleyomyces rouxiae]|uniref:uncharacterized protein n=1 Tax=Berkeleyomyces rouxiae TaxID=2035830 RepID=UPI003B7DDF8E